MIRLVDAPSLLAIPMFTFAGFLLAASKAPARIVQLSNAFLGWMPGGLAIVAIISCTLLTALTGASGVTIVALGGLLYPSLIQQGYSDRFTTGLLTTAGSRGLLFPPSLPLILYAVVAQINIDQLFRACLIPGILSLSLVLLYCFWTGRGFQKEKLTFSWPYAFQTLKSCGMELPIPIVVLGGIYGGIFTATEASCIVALYTLILECWILKEVSLTKDLPKVIGDAMMLVASILIILSAALAFTSYLVDEQIPMKLLAWIQENVHSKIVFLLFLNLFILILCVMDGLSAIIIAVPLIHPIASSMGINPFHLGAIFLANLEIGYSTPPLGMNLFIASNRFAKPILQLCKDSLPFLLLLFLALLLITYIPAISLCLL
jgi:tripartite ATP-independent transporter DctM subunit